jgi:hypothetical protein
MPLIIPFQDEPKAVFRVTARNVNDHNCLISDSVCFDSPGGGGITPKGVATKLSFAELYTHDHTSCDS